MTSTAIVRVEPQAVAVTTQYDVMPAMSWSEMLQMGNELVRTGFLPDAIKTGAQAAAIILAGREMGIPPMRAFRTLYIFKGKIDEYADSQLARFKAKGGHARFVTLDATQAVLELRHPNGDPHTETFTIADAKASGIFDMNANYKKNPKAMLRSRVITNGLKSLGWEDAAGSYDPMETELFADQPVAHPTGVPDIKKMDAAGVRAAIETEYVRLTVSEADRAESTARINGGRAPASLGEAREVLEVLQELPTPSAGGNETGDVQPTESEA